MPENQALNEIVERHYAPSPIGDRILGALKAAGKDLDHLTVEDLAPVDEFHILGRAATLALAATAEINRAQHVLDVGCGIGGTSRCLASEFGCRVTGIDLTEEFCRTAAMLTELTGLSELVDYRQGDATELPFGDRSFDVVWSEHAAMNIPDKRRLYDEMYRVLKPGGTVAIYDILAGPGGEVQYPAPWARTPETSFLVTPAELRRLLEEAGFQIVSWSDMTEGSAGWFVSLIEQIREHGVPPLGLHVLMGPEFSQMAQNQARNLLERRTEVARVVGRK